MRYFFPLLSLTMACSDYGFQRPVVASDGGLPAIQVEPRALDFWAVEAGDSRTLSFTIANVGDAVLDIDDLTLSGDDGFSLVTEEIEFTLEPQSAREIEVAFAPVLSGALSGEVLVLSTDPDEPSIPVTLDGEGVAPQLAITPELHDFGALEIPCDDSVQLTLQNVGSSALTLSEAQLSSAQFSLRDLPELPLTLDPGAWTTAWIDVTAAEVGAAENTLTVSSDDPRGEALATQTVEVDYAGQGYDTFVVGDAEPVDVLFAVDQSCSMDDDAERLGANFREFIDSLSEATNDWHIGVVTYDSGCLNNGVLTSDTPGAEALFIEGVQEGTDQEIVNDEALFQIVDRALQLSTEGACNDGFLRDDAPLHVIVVTDEPERSTETASTWTWDYWLERFEAYPASPSQLTISGVVDSEDCNEGDDGYAEAISYTGGEALSICQEDWSGYAVELAQTSLTWIFSYPLSADPVSDTIEVYVDGSLVADGWSWDAASNAIVFDELEPGQTIEVSYDLIGTCD